MNFDIATAPSGNSKKWKNKNISWEDFVQKLSEPRHTSETVAEFFKMSKDDQASIKDVGAYFGGYIRSGRRLKSNILHRQLVTLDLDFAPQYFWDDYIMNYSCASILHGTHKYLEEAPKLRLLILLDREVTCDEYTAISRRIAGNLGLEYFDPTTFDVNRFMYWQSSPIDVDYYFERLDGEPLNADSVLAEYVDWTDLNEHPRHDQEREATHKLVKTAETPTEKKGLIGYFCRTYSISEAIDKFLSGVYEVSEISANRYTYIGGTTHGGAVVYDDMFLYSHHSTDPCCNTLVNAYDLVATHFFEGLSTLDKTRKMDELILSDDDVKETIARERLEDLSDFDGLELDEEAEAIDLSENIEWMKQLETDKQGKYLSTAKNFAKIIRNDTRLKGVFAYNLFANRIYVLNSLAWRKINRAEPMNNVDYSGLRTYIEQVYGISSPQKVDDCLIIEANFNKYHPVKQYLTNLVWDGKKRISELFPYWLGAEDCEYTYSVTKQFLRGAVSRIFEAGNKFDYVLTFVGEQGAGKSAIASKLGGEWFSDTLMGIKGKDGFEALQGYWIVEMAELSGLRKSDLESQKHYIAKAKDSFRPAYGRVVEDFPRQNVFIATTNDVTFLKDMTGNRRFLPIMVDRSLALDHPYKMSQDYVDQIWAEAVCIYKGESYEDIANLATVQEQFLEIDPRTSLISEYLGIKIPTDFYDREIEDRVIYYTMGEYKTYNINSIYRTVISPIEVFVECLGGDVTKMNRQDLRAIREVLTNLKWTPIKDPRKLKKYGSQRCHTK